MTTCGVGTGPLPGDPSNDITLTAVAAFGGVDLSWSFPSTNPHAVAYVKIYRSTSQIFASSIKIAEAGGSYFFDKRPVAATYYYWIQVISINGTLVATAGPAFALSKLAVGEVIEQLTGVIDDGLLATALRNKVEQISVINANLADEIFDRETGETSLSEAIADVADGVAEAHTFIINERDSRVLQNSAMVEQIAGIIATVGGDIGSVIAAMNVRIDTVEDAQGALDTTVNTMYTVKLTANNQVGGFGLTNDGTTVEAGFDVDKFWIGRTNADRRKPFILTDGVVYINEAVIPTLTADKINTNGLIIRDGSGNPILGAGNPLAIAFAANGTRNDAITINGSGQITGIGTGNSTAVANSLLTASIQAAQDAATAAAETANSASTAAALSTTALSDLARDDRLTPIEKQAIQLEWNVINDEKPLINAQATTAVTTTPCATQNTAYNAAYTALSTYIVPLLTAFTTTSDINGTVFRATFASYYSTRQTLLNKIAETAASVFAGNVTGSVAGTAAATLLSNANAALENAATANSLLTDIASDSRLTPIEKQAAQLEWNTISNEKPLINAQAMTAVTTTPCATENTAYNAVYTALGDYIVPKLNTPTVTDTIDGVEFRGKFNDYYTARQVLLNKIAATAASVFAGNVTGTVNGTAAATLVTNASTALGNAATANSLLGDIANDNKLTPVEKSAVQLEWNVISAEQPGIDSQATATGFTGPCSSERTAYNSAYATLSAYVVPPSGVLTNLTTTTDISGTTFRSTFSAYYTARQVLLNKIAATAATLASWTSITGVPGNVTNATANRVFKQDSAPGGTLYAGDFWFKTLNGNVIGIHTYSGSAWVLQSRMGISTSRAISGSSWLDSEANLAIAARGNTPFPGDVVNLHNLSTGYSQTFMLNADGGGWVPITAFWSGNQVVDGTLSASALMAGSVFVGMTFRVGTAAVSGTTMTGSGGAINSTGTFALGNSTTNITFNGSTMVMNGAWVNSSNLKFTTLSASASPSSVGLAGAPNAESNTNVTVTPTGGDSPYSYAWSYIMYSSIAGATSGISNTSGNSANILLKVGDSGSSSSGIAICTVTDKNGRVATASTTTSVNSTS